jgi:regulator of RNase E activity RraA
MSLRAKKLGAAGVIVDGRVRDLQEHRDLEFPVSDPTRLPAPVCLLPQVFARAAGTTAGGAVCFPSEINVPVKLQSSIQDVVIRPGDFIVADLDGVVCLPADLAEEVLSKIPDIVEADKKCAEAIRNGMIVQEAFATFRGK